MAYYTSEAYGLVCDGCGAKVIDRPKHNEFHADIEKMKQHMEDADLRKAIEDEQLQEYGPDPVHCDESCVGVAHDGLGRGCGAP